jgi:hypothetical protein
MIISTSNMDVFWFLVFREVCDIWLWYKNMQSDTGYINLTSRLTVYYTQILSCFHLGSLNFATHSDLAFTPGCSKSHLPGYLNRLNELKAQGIDRVACVSVNDAFVMQAWADGMCSPNLSLFVTTSYLNHCVSIDIYGTLCSTYILSILVDLPTSEQCWGQDGHVCRSLC